MRRLQYIWQFCLLLALLWGFPGPLQGQQGLPKEKDQVKQWERDIKDLRERKSLDEQLDRQALSKSLKHKGLTGTAKKDKLKKKQYSKGQNRPQKIKSGDVRSLEQEKEVLRRRQWMHGLDEKTDKSPYSAEQTNRLLKERKAKLAEEEKMANKAQEKAKGKSKKEVHPQVERTPQPLEVPIEARQGRQQALEVPLEERQQAGQPTGASGTDQKSSQSLPIPDEDRGKFISGKQVF